MSFGLIGLLKLGKYSEIGALQILACLRILHAYIF